MVLSSSRVASFVFREKPFSICPLLALLLAACAWKGGLCSTVTRAVPPGVLLRCPFKASTGREGPHAAGLCRPCRPWRAAFSELPLKITEKGRQQGKFTIIVFLLSSLRELFTLRS